MGTPSTERSWASRFRRKPKAERTPEEIERFKSYQQRRGRPGRPPNAGSSGAPAPAAPAAPEATQEPPAPRPDLPGAGGQGGDAGPPGGPPIDLGAPAANEDGGAAPGAEDAAAKAAAERSALIRGASAYIVNLLRQCEPIIRAAQLPMPPLPELVLVVTGKCWEVTLDKWLPAEVGDPTDYAELVACSMTGYQLAVTWWAGKRLKARETETPAVATSAPSSSASAPSSAAAPTPATPTPAPSRPRPPNFWGVPPAPPRAAETPAAS